MPSTVVTLIFPVTAPSGTWKCRSVSVLDRIKPAGTATSPILTTGCPVAARRLVPDTMISSVLPATAPAGGAVKLVIFGSTLKTIALGAVPVALVRLTGPVSAPAGTVAVTVVAVVAVGVTVTGPVNVTLVGPAKFVAVITTVAPTGAAAGMKAVARGGWSTVRFVALTAVPSMVVTLIFPVTAPSGTRKSSSVRVLDAIKPAGTATSPTFTTGWPVAARRLVPATVTTSPLPATAPAGGAVKLVIFGITLKTAVLGALPMELLRLTGPVSAPSGTVAVTVVAVIAVAVTVAGPVNVTLVGPARFVAVITTVAPTGAAGGMKAVARGG